MTNYLASIASALEVTTVNNLASFTWFTEREALSHDELEHALPEAALRDRLVVALQARLYDPGHS